MQLEPFTAKVARLLAGLDASLAERRTHIRVALLALLAGHHVLLLGPPGTAKSQLARALCSCVQGAHFFEYLLSKFTHPDELFGPVSIPGLKEEDYRRLTDGYLPTAHIAFLDEIFKANSAILNSLLTLINERVFHHGKHRDAVPLLGLVGASNETPEVGGGLTALYDRFLVRLTVPPIVDDRAFLQVCLGQLPAFRPPDEDRLTVAEIQRFRRLSAEIDADEPTRQALLRIRAALRTAEVEVSDRRWRWAIDLLRMSALTSGRRALSLLDLFLLEHCFGDAETTEGVVRKCVHDALAGAIQDDLYLDPLRRKWNEIRGRKIQGSFAVWRQQMLVGPDDFIGACGKASTCLDQQLERTKREAAATPWLSEGPSVLAAGLLATRMRIQQLRGFADRARSDLLARSPAAQVAQYLQKHRSNGYYGHYACIWIRPSAAREWWYGIDTDGGVSPSREPPDDRPRLEFDDTVAHECLGLEAAAALARRLAETALSPLLATRATNTPLARQVHQHRDLLSSCVSALQRWIEKMRQQGIAPHGLPELPEPAASTSDAQGTARAA